MRTWRRTPASRRLFRAKIGSAPQRLALLRHSVLPWPAAAQFFPFDDRFFGPAAAPAAAISPSRPDRSRAGQRAGGQAPGSAADHPHPGARRFDGGLAGLRSGRGARRDARNRRRAQAQGLFRPDPLRAAQRGRMVADRARYDRGRKAASHRHDGRPPRPAGDARTVAAAAPNRRPAGGNAAAPRAVAAPHGAGSAQRLRPQSRAANPNDDEPTCRRAPNRSARAPAGPAEFRTEKWAELYTQRIDETIAALKTGRCAGVLGRPAVGARREVDQRHALSQRARARPRREGRHHLRRCLGRLRRRARQFHASAAPTAKDRSAGCAPATACISPSPAPASSRIMSSASCAACCANRSRRR